MNDPALNHASGNDTSRNDSPENDPTESAPERGGPPRRFFLLLNPGSRAADRIGELLLGELRGHAIEVCVPESAAQTAEIARSAAQRAFDRLLVAGGDGTLSQVVRALAPEFPEIELAALPFGTGNDFARCLGLSADRLAQAARAAIEAPAIPIDAVRCELDERVSYFLNVANGGFGGRVARSVNLQSKDLVGSLAYWFAGAANATSPHAYDITLELDGRSRSEAVIGLAIANGRYVGGGFPIAPEASVSDGLLDVTVIPDLSELEMLAAGTRYMLVGDAEESPAELLRARSIVIQSSPAMPFSIDGELVKVERTRFDIVPGAVKMVATSSAEGLGTAADSGMWEG